MIDEYLILGLPILWFAAPAGALVALLASWAFYRSAGKREASIKELEATENAIEKGLKTYISSYYKILIAVVAVILAFICIVTFHLKLLPILTPFAFLTGFLLQGLSEYISLRKGFESSIRTVGESRKSLSSGFRTAFRTSASIGLMVNGIPILGISVLFLISMVILKYDVYQTAFVILGFCFGTSILSFFTRVSGGIFTKAADIASDLVGKTEVSITEDDPRNPAVIVDKIGNITGKIAGMASDLFESFTFSIAGAIILGLYITTGKPFDTQMSFASVPMFISAAGVIISIIGILIIRAKQVTTAKNIFTNVKIALGVVYILSIIAEYFAVYLLIPADIGIFWSAVSGILAGIVIGESSYYYTSYDHHPTQRVIHSTTSGSSTVIINGLTIGMISSWIPSLTLAAAVLLAYIIPGGLTDIPIGLYGIGIASIGMLSTVAMILTLNIYGGISDNAAGITKTSNMEPFIKERIQNLEEIGIKTSGLTRGIPVAYMMIITMALLCTFKVEMTQITAKMLVSVILGGLTIFVLSGIIMRSVAKTTHLMIEEIRKQFREIQGLVAGDTKPNYAACMQISSKGSRKGVILPMILGILIPCVTALLLGVSGSIGLILGATATGFLFAIMMTTSGHIWGSTKRFIESGKHGGKDAPAHNAAVIADTVGDPLKDAVSPSINVFVKLILIIFLLFGNILAQYSDMLLEFIKNLRF
ncbi:MAG: sodium-translocating pyrophosphatase [Proteobacteria bacterium]|nr:sodium-translocating pyrophosphatase [Pseudomonadota bacterium]